MKTLRAPAALLTLALATACSLGGGHRLAPAFFDLGPLPAQEDRGKPAVLLGTVSGAPAVTVSDIRYRRASEPYRILSYTESRWLAPPPDLVARRLRALLTSVGEPAESGAASGQSGTRLRLEVVVETFEQVFDSETSARGVLRLRASLQDTATRRLLAEKTFSSEQPTPTADAVGAVQTLGRLTDDTLQQVLAWIAEVAATG